jgi:hypothetical protein
MKKRLLLMVGLLVGLAGAAFAEIPSDSFTITFTPSGDRGVIISTTVVALGGIVPGTPQYSLAIPVVSTGSIGNIEYSISGAVTVGTALLTAHDAAVAVGDVRVRALFDDSGAGVTWGDDDNVDGVDATDDVNDGGRYVQGDTTESMEGLGLNVERKLFCEVLVPLGATYAGAQEVTITVTARQGD